MAPSMPTTAWRSDTANDGTSGDDTDHSDIRLISINGFVPAHKIMESFMNRHSVSPVVRLTWNIDSQPPQSSIFAIADVSTFANLRRTVADNATLVVDDMAGHQLRHPRLHIDKYTIEIGDRHGRRISSEVRNKSQKNRGTGTRYPPASFNALMKSVSARIMTQNGHCICETDHYNDNDDSEEDLEPLEKCPEIRVWLSSLDASNERQFKLELKGVRRKDKRELRKVHSNKIVRIQTKVSTSSLRKDASSDQAIAQQERLTNPRLLINAACLRRLLDEKSAQNEVSPTPSSLRYRDLPTEALMLWNKEAYGGVEAKDEKVNEDHEMDVDTDDEGDNSDEADEFTEWQGFDNDDMNDADFELSNEGDETPYPRRTSGRRATKSIPFRPVANSVVMLDSSDDSSQDEIPYRANVKGDENMGVTFTGSQHTQDSLFVDVDEDADAMTVVPPRPRWTPVQEYWDPVKHRWCMRNGPKSTTKSA